MGPVVGAAGEKAARLAETVAAGDAYTALQTYKTFHARSQKKGDWSVALDVVRSGSLVMLKHHELTAGTELALLLVDTLEAGKVEQTAELIDVVRDISSAFELVEGNKELKLEAARNQARFLKQAITWSQLDHCGQHLRGDPALHLLRAKSLTRSGQLSAAASNYLHTGQPKEFATFLFSWTCMGYASERDLFLARAVLQLLALENLRDANVLYESFVGLLALKGQPLKPTPLANFVRMLLKTVEREAYPLFQVLVQKYTPSLNRDASFQQLLDRIQEVYFGVRVQKRGMQAMLDNMLGMFGGR